MVAWDAADERRLFALVAEHGTRWTNFADGHFRGTKSENDCKNRWYSARRRLEKALGVGPDRAGRLLDDYAGEVAAGTMAADASKAFEQNVLDCGGNIAQLRVRGRAPAPAPARAPAAPAPPENSDWRLRVRKGEAWEERRRWLVRQGRG